MASVSVRDVAALAGVSVGTVSNVLNRPDKVAPEVSERVNSAIGRLGYVRNGAARQLRAGRSRSIGLVVLDVGNPFFTDLARGAEKRAAEEGLTVLLADTHEDAARESAHLDVFEEQRVFGLLLSPLADSVSRLERLRARGTPTVLVERQAQDRLFSSVVVDNVAGGASAVEHLIGIGRRRIAFVGGPHSIRQVAERFEGARGAVARHPGTTLEVIDTESLSVVDGREVGRRIAERDPITRPDAVFAANDLLAIGLLQAFMLHELKIPDDIALIGYDDIAYASSSIVALSSIRQPSTLIGYTAVDLLIKEVAAGSASDSEQVVFQPELVVRASTGGEAPSRPGSDVVSPE